MKNKLIIQFIKPINPNFILITSICMAVAKQSYLLVRSDLLKNFNNVQKTLLSFFSVNIAIDHFQSAQISNDMFVTYIIRRNHSGNDNS